ncbi:hypothetical protein CYD85_17915, partial [Klebsiella pneumoniae]
GTVCVVGKMRDLILQLSKSSIYSTKPWWWCPCSKLLSFIVRLMRLHGNIHYVATLCNLVNCGL